MSYSFLLCVNVLYIVMLSLVFPEESQKNSISVSSGPFTVIICYHSHFILFRFYIYFFLSSRFTPAPKTTLRNLKKSGWQIYLQVKLTNFNFWQLQSIQLTLLDMIGSFIVFLTIVNCVNWLRCLDTIDNKPKRGNNMAFAPVETSFKDNFQNPFRFPFVFKSYIC